MGRVNWGGFTFDSDLLVQTKKCITCRDDFPENEINVNGMCNKCQEIENKLLEKLAGTWANKVLDNEEQQLKSQIGWW